MGIAISVKDIVTVISIVSLIMTGILITLKSGDGSLGTGQSQFVRGNISRLAISLAGCFLFLTMVQQVVGFRLGWN